MSSFFRKKKIVTQETLGERFCKVRLGKNWSLEKAAKVCNISQHHLQALEKSQYDEIPGEVYIKNFIKTYGQYLGLNTQECLAQYTQEQQVIEQKKHHRFLKEITPQTICQKLLLPRTIKISAVCLIATAVLSYIIWNTYHTVAPPELEVYNPKNNTETYEHLITVLGKSETHAQVRVNNQKILLRDNGEFAHDVMLRNGLNLIIVSAKRKHGIEKKIVRHVLVNQSTNPITQR